MNEQILSLLAAGFFGLLFWLTGTRLTGNQPFKLGLGRYAGAFPLIGAVVGAILPTGIWQETSLLACCGGALFLAILGYLRDRYQAHYSTLLPWGMLAIALALFIALPEPVSGLRIATGVTWVLLIILCLKISALVYEMPFILIATTSLSQFIIFSTDAHSMLAGVFNLALLTNSVMLLIYSATGRRVLTGSSGVFTAGFLLAAVSQLEGSGNLLLFGLFIPSMVIFFPFALISSMIVASYFGNRLHKPVSGSERQWSWSLQREKTLVFSGMVFLCLNFFGLLVVVNAPAFGYFALFLLLVSALAGFVGTFARQSKTDAATPLKIEMLGIFIDTVLPGQVIERIADYLLNHRPGLMHIITADSLALVRAGEEEHFRSVMQRAEMVVPDGAGIVWAADFLGTPLPGRVPGVALVGQICEKAAETRWKIFFVGGKPGIAEQAAQTLSQEYQFEVCGIEHGYFAQDSADEELVMKKIAAARPDIIFVALGVPRQEWFITKLRGYLDAGVAIGVGGSFDVISQTLRRAPVWMQRCGIEWLFRLWLEPTRFMRMAKIPVFVLQILRCKWNRPEA
ncbi:MAG TPA: WecB/TagA/CpsF family glycosyltransferase [Candidatus Rifleibacterium sp.]|nr:WecB/TagA/CpsF family glycosyltransferase [Candidatus Rifleibacterium sp.]HPT44973.1 WecB/TagA/CpsF family glycosyltransferase [Candidatus Rifleibacterium sp.]